MRQCVLFNPFITKWGHFTSISILRILAPPQKFVVMCGRLVRLVVKPGMSTRTDIDRYYLERAIASSIKIVIILIILDS